MIVFMVVTALVLVAVLAYLLLPALRGRHIGSGDDVGRRRKAVKTALAEGVISQEEFDSKMAAIAGSSADGQDDAAKPALTTSTKLVAAIVALALPIGALLLYRQIGQPDALDMAAPTQMPANTVSGQSAATGATGMDMSMAISSLKSKLEKNPGDVDGWLLLGRAYKSVESNSEASDALAKAYALAPERPEIEIAYAEALALANPSRRIDGKPLQMIKHALAADPSNQDGLWLLGMSAYQNGKYADAILSWEKILVQLGPDSDVLESVTNMIGDAKAHLAGGDALAATAAGLAPAAVAGPASGPQIKVHVVVAERQMQKVRPGDTLFIYAKAASGPPMPIAIQKLQASALPITVTLTDGMGMMPSMNLSQFPKVIISARISRSGNAIAQSGDLQAVSPVIDVGQRATVELSIDQVVP